MVLPIKDVKPTYRQSESSWRLLENLSQSSSIISPISSPADILAPQTSNATPKVLFSSVLPYNKQTRQMKMMILWSNWQTLRTWYNKATMQKIFSSTKSRHQQLGSPAGHHLRFKPTTLFAISANLRLNHGIRRFSLRSNKDWLAPGCIHWFSKQNRRRIRQVASSKLKICRVLPPHQMKWVVQNQTVNSYQQRKTSQATNKSFGKIQ